MLRSDLCDYSDSYIVVKGIIDLLATAAANENVKAQKNLHLKIMLHLDHAFQKLNSTPIDNAEDLDMVMPMCNLLEYSQNYSMTAASLWNCYRDEIDDVDDNISDGKSFKYKTKIVGKTPVRPEWSERAPQQPPNLDGSQLQRPERPPQPPVSGLNTEVTIPLKELSNFWRFFDLPLINCEIELNLSWTKDSVLTEHYNDITGATFQINNAKLYVRVVTLTVNYNIKFLENTKQRYKRTVSWNKYRSEITTQPKNNNLDYLINPTFRNINRLFPLSFKKW